MRKRYRGGMLGLLLAVTVAQEITLLAPESVRAGEEVVLRSAPGVELRVVGPTRTLGEVAATSLPVRTGPGATFDLRGVLYRGERVLIAAVTPEDWCAVLLPNGGRGFVSCPFLNRSEFGQPLGVTKEDGSLTTSALAVVPAELELAAYRDHQPVAQAHLTVMPFVYDRSESIAPGIEFRERRWVTEGDGPFTLQALEVDPRHPAVNLLPVRALDRTIGRERPTSMARRYGATAAVNAGYFVTSGPYMGASSGVYQFDRQVQSGGSGRTALLFCAERNFIEQVAFDVVNFQGRVTAPSGASATITGLNRARGAQDLLVYQPNLGPRTLTDHSGVEAVLDAAGRVTQLRVGEGNSEIPTDAVVLSGSGAGAAWLRAHARPGTPLTVSLLLQPSAPAPDCDPLDIVGGGPRLVSGGRVNITGERFGHENTRHPRTAAAITRRGTLLFLTLDGRQPASAGMRLDEFAHELLRWGAVEAMNLDGGGSSALITRDRIRNTPSDGAERAVSDAILIYSIANKEDLAALLSALGEQMRPETLLRLRSALSDGIEAFRKALATVEAHHISVAALRLLRESAAGLY